MLPFKRKFLEAIRSGEKTQTLRVWKSARVRANQESLIPGVGPIWIDSVEQVSFDQLTDADAIPDGFSTLAALKEEIQKIYGYSPKGALFRVRFHLLEADSSVLSPACESVELVVDSHIDSGTDLESDTVSGMGIVPSGRGLGAVSPMEVSVVDDEPHLVDTSLDTAFQEVTGIQCFVEGLKKKFSEIVVDSCVEMNSGKTNESNESVKEYSNEMALKVGGGVSPDLLTEEQVVEKMVRRCRINRNVCDWNHEPGKSQDFFALFLQSPRNAQGIPVLDGYRLRSLMRVAVTEEQWEEICWIASEVCSAWTEWQYAIEHWIKVGEVSICPKK